MPIQQTTRLLAIDPGTHEMGVAVCQGAALLYHGVKVIQKGRSPRETLDRAMSAVGGLIDDFRPEVLVVEHTFIGRNRNAALLNVLADEIQALGRRARLTVLWFAPNAVKKAITGYGWATKAEVAKAVAGRYPELKAYLVHDRKWKARFHENMFDAVALGMMALV
jgi:Holliday junction resolvasome RuvABC endonuclease subunit